MEEGWRDDAPKGKDDWEAALLMPQTDLPALPSQKGGSWGFFYGRDCMYNRVIDCLLLQNESKQKNI